MSEPKSDELLNQPTMRDIGLLPEKGLLKEINIQPVVRRPIPKHLEGKDLLSLVDNQYREWLVLGVPFIADERAGGHRVREDGKPKRRLIIRRRPPNLEEMKEIVSFLNKYQPPPAKTRYIGAMPQRQPKEEQDVTLEQRANAKFATKSKA